MITVKPLTARGKKIVQSTRSIIVVDKTGNPTRFGKRPGSKTKQQQQQKDDEPEEEESGMETEGEDEEDTLDVSDMTVAGMDTGAGSEVDN